MVGLGGSWGWETWLMMELDTRQPIGDALCILFVLRIIAIKTLDNAYLALFFRSSPPRSL